MSCSDTTGPSFIDNSYLTIIETNTGTITSSIELDILNRGLCITGDGSWAYVGDLLGYSGYSILQIDCSSSSISGGIDFGWSGCIDLCINDGESELYALGPFHSVYTIEIPSMTLVDSIDVQLAVPGSILLRPETDLLYVFDDYSSLVHIIDMQHGSIIDTITVSHELYPDPVFSSSGDDLYAVNGTTICRHDPETGDVIAQSDIGEVVSDICINNDSNTLYASWWVFGSWNEGGVVALDATSLSPVGSIDLLVRTGNLCYVSALDQLYVETASSLYDCSITVMDLPGLVPTKEISIAPAPVCMVSDAQGTRVYCSIYENNETD